MLTAMYLYYCHKAEVYPAFLPFLLVVGADVSIIEAFIK